MPRYTFFHQGYVPYLLRRISDSLSDRFTAGLKPYGLTIPMWRIIAVLHGRGATRFHVLVSQTLIEPPTLSRYLKDLRSMGYIATASSSVDARGVLITPTQYVAFNVGVPFAISGFIAAIVGGFGRPLGAFVGGIMLGLAQAVAIVAFGAGLKNVAALSVLLVFLFIRPGGILGEAK